MNKKNLVLVLTLCLLLCTGCGKEENKQTNNSNTVSENKLENKTENKTNTKSLHCEIDMEDGDSSFAFNFEDDTLKNVTMSYEVLDVLKGLSNEEITEAVDNMKKDLDDTEGFSNTNITASDEDVTVSTQMDINSFIEILGVDSKDIHLSYDYVKESLQAEGYECK